MVLLAREKARQKKRSSKYGFEAMALVAVLYLWGFHEGSLQVLASSQNDEIESLYDFNIEPQSLHSALIEFAQQAGLQLVWRADEVENVEVQGIKNRMRLDSALKALLENVDTDFTITSGNVVVLVPIEAESGIVPVEETSNFQRFETAVYRKPYTLPENEEITVTGTRLRPLEEEARFTKRDALTRDDIKRGGYNDFLNVIVDLPIVNAPVTPENTQTSIPSSGQSFVELRGLGTNRTLVLFQGRRSVSSSYIANRIDLNSVPVDLVNRVEFVRGGASAVYGSDAIAGAVNIIFEDSFDGARLRVRGGSSQQGGGEEAGISFLSGRYFNDEKSHIQVYLSAEYEGAIRAPDRDFALISLEYEPDENELDIPDLSSFIPGGRFPRPGPDFFFDESGLRGDFSTDENGFDFRPFQTLSIPQERYYASFSFKHLFDRGIEFFSNIHVSSVEAISQRAPQPISDNDTNFLIPLDNPFIPAEVREDALSRGTEGIGYRRRLAELGRRARENERVTLRNWAGLRQDSGSVAWEVVAGYTRFTQEQSRKGIVNLLNFVNALQVESVPGNPEVYQCNNAEARQSGCVPLNLFGIGSISEDARAYIVHEDKLQATLEQYTLSGSVSGPLFTVSAGTVDAALGLEYRRDSIDLDTDPLTSANATTVNPVAAFEASQSILDIFSEIRTPLVKDRVLAESVVASAAARVSFFDQGAKKTGLSYNLNLSWIPVSAFQFIVGYAQSIREPDLTERFSPARGDNDFVRDPCDGIDGSGSDILTVNCLAEAGIASAILADGIFEQGETTIFGPNSGNPDIKFETGNTLSLRAFFSPDWRWEPKLSIEYFDTEVRDAIEQFSSSQIARQCYLRDDPDRIQFCQFITRDIFGQITEIQNQQLNLIHLNSEGIETELSFTVPLAPWGEALDLEVVGRHTRLLELNEEFDSPVDGGLLDNDLGEPGSARDTAQLLINANAESWGFRWRSQYFGPTIDSDSRTRLFRELGISDPLFFDIEESWRHDIYVERKFPNAEARLFAGINNILDDTGPFFPDGTVQGGADNHISDFDLVGRFFFAGLEKNF